MRWIFSFQTGTNRRRTKRESAHQFSTGAELGIAMQHVFYLKIIRSM